MKVGKLLLALTFTLMLLLTARKLAMVQPRLMENMSNGIALTHLNPGKVSENQSVTIQSEVAPPLKPGQKLLLSFAYSSLNAEWAVAEMRPSQPESNSFIAQVNGQAKGENFFYYFEVQDSLGQVISNLGTEQVPLRFRFEGKVPSYIIGPHIFLMFAGAFFAFLALFGAFGLLKAQGEINTVVRQVGWTTLFIFIGGFPLGIMVARAAVGGTGWEGFPLGKDITDNKTLLIFLFWLLLVILGKGSIFQSNPEQNLVKPSTYGKLTLVGFLLLLGLYLIPHSL